nr:glycoside hydrolase family 95 protein [Hymenobacter qilianensis]
MLGCRAAGHSRQAHANPAAAVVRPARCQLERGPALGNGRLGVMVFGAPERERIQLNEETIWAGGPNNNVKPNALSVIRQLREQLRAGQLVEAQALAQTQMQPYGNSGMPYQMAANVYLDFSGHEKAAHYQRDLDISRAVASVSYQLGAFRTGGRYSAPCPIRLSSCASRPASPARSAASLARKA